MKRSVLTRTSLLAFSVLAASIAFGQAGDKTPPSSMEVVIPDGTFIRAELKKGLDANKARVDHPVKLEVTADVRDPVTGVVLVPKKTKVYGRVTRVDVSKEKNGRAAVSILLDRAEWQGSVARLSASIVGVETVGGGLLDPSGVFSGMGGSCTLWIPEYSQGRIHQLHMREVGKPTAT